MKPDYMQFSSVVAVNGDAITEVDCIIKGLVCFVSTVETRLDPDWIYEM